jgi:hypothetical protein
MALVVTRLAQLFYLFVAQYESEGAPTSDRDDEAVSFVSKTYHGKGPKISVLISLFHDAPHGHYV